MKRTRPNSESSGGISLLQAWRHNLWPSLKRGQEMTGRARPSAARWFPNPRNALLGHWAEALTLKHTRKAYKSTPANHHVHLTVHATKTVIMTTKSLSVKSVSLNNVWTQQSLKTIETVQKAFGRFRVSSASHPVVEGLLWYLFKCAQCKITLLLPGALSESTQEICWVCQSVLLSEGYWRLKGSEAASCGAIKTIWLYRFIPWWWIPVTLLFFFNIIVRLNFLVWSKMLHYILDRLANH